jgi:glycosyltransferase involved in cell wall biosynthesis
MGLPSLSIVMPAHNEADRIAPTLASIARTRSAPIELEVVIVDDASTDGCCERLATEFPKLGLANVTVRVVRLPQRVGVPAGRNEAARAASGDIVFITDAHVQFTPGWDRLVLDNIREDRILAATITDPTSAFHGYGCDLIVPFMGTRWRRERPRGPAAVQIASSAGTVLTRDLFDRIGGYDEGMLLYAAAEPEFSLRAWLSGAEIVCLPDLEVCHRFKPESERDAFLESARPYMIHNSLRFGIIYLDEARAFQMLRHFAMIYPMQVQQAYRLLLESAVWERRSGLAGQLTRSFAWFVERFDLRDQIGAELALDPTSMSSAGMAAASARQG